LAYIDAVDDDEPGQVFPMTFGYEKEIETLNLDTGEFEVYRQLADFLWEGDDCVTRVGNYFYRIKENIVRVNLSQVRVTLGKLTINGDNNTLTIFPLGRRNRWNSRARKCGC